MSMSSVRSRSSLLMKDLKRVVSPVYLMGLVGQRMYRRAVRRTGIIGLASLSVSIVGRGMGVLPGFGVKQAALFTVVFGCVSLLGGMALRTISNMLMSERINIAEANNLNLLQDKKKSRLDFYLRRLYHSVFRYEAAIRYSDEEIRQEEEDIRKNVKEIAGKLIANLSSENLGFLGVQDLSGMVDHMNACNPLKPRELEKSWEGFRITARYALTHPLPASLEADIIGFDLTMVEDWLDGACFDANDVKLIEQYRANSTIVLIKQQIGYGFRDRVWRWRKAFSHSFWFHNTFRSVAISVGTQIKRMNRKVGRGYFKAEHFLWVDPELDRCVERRFGREVLDELIRRRKHLIWKIFSKEYEGAVELLRRIYRPKIELAIDLRKRLDVEYMLGELDGASYVRDLERLAFSPPRMERQRARVEEARKKDTLLTRYLNEKGELPSGNRTSVQRRAVRIAAHLNFSGLGELLGKYYAPRGAAGDQDKRTAQREAIRHIVSRAAEQEDRFSDWLVTVRTFWLLNWLEFEEYCRHLKEIAYTGENAVALR